MPSFLNSGLATFSQRKATDYNVFWAEIAPCEHILDIYSDEADFLASLISFVETGIKSGDSVILIATQSHLLHVEATLRQKGIELRKLREEGKYLTQDAQEILSRFMVNGWPDDRKFQEVIISLLGQVRRDGSKVRAFGEMVALLWADNLSAATVRLEHLWGELCHRSEISLFCAYPLAGITEDPTNSIQKIIEAHSRLIA